MKVAIFCFSGTGNTYYVADTIRKLLNESHTCDLFAIEHHLEDADAIIERYDVIGLGYPTHGSSLPTIVFQFIHYLSMHTKKAFTFCTQLLFSGDGAAYGARQLAKKGFDVLWQEHFFMPNNITDVRFLDHKSPYPYAKIARVVQRKATKFVQGIQKGKVHRKGSNWFSLLLGLSQRYPYERMDKSVLANSIKVNNDWCIHCGLCLRLCPTQNLTMDYGRIQTHGQCTICYRCVNHCPAQALHMMASRVKYPYKGPTPSFDIHQVAKDQVNEPSNM